jgi:predicted nucleotidyltransferase
MESDPVTPARCREIAARVCRDLTEYHPKTVVLFGSAARFLERSAPSSAPNDLDILVVCHNPPWRVQRSAYGLPVELHRYHTDDIVAVAKCLRYDSRPVALAKLYARQAIARHARGVIAACLLLGPGYNHFGIEQIDVNGLPDPRDYSVHTVLAGRSWWQRLQAYATERRGPLKRFSDQLVNRHEFRP